jgi:hypothetical protein
MMTLGNNPAHISLPRHLVPVTDASLGFLHNHLCVSLQFRIFFLYIYIIRNLQSAMKKKNQGEVSQRKQFTIVDFNSWWWHDLPKYILSQSIVLFFKLYLRNPRLFIIIRLKSKILWIINKSSTHHVILILLALRE